MCGIVGFITAAANGFIQDELNAFRDMLVVDSVRGFDSTGVYGVANTGNVEIAKAAMTGAQFVTTKEYKAFSSEAYMQGQFIVGHNRYATIGTVNDKNAHPFWVDDKIILVQNGTYKGSHKHHKDVEVDTEAIAHVLSEEPDVSKALKKVNAAYALVWYNTENHTLHMIRNNERPLWHADTKFGSVMFASEPEFILMAASRNKLALKGLPELIDENTLYTYKLNKDTTWDYDEQKIDVEYDFRTGPTNYGNRNVLSSHWYDAGTHRHSPWKERLEELAEEEAANQQVHSAPTQLPGTIHPKDSSMTAYHSIYAGDFHEFHVNETESRELTQLISDNYNRRHMIEFFDYRPGNTHNKCEVWHIYGRVLEAEETEAPRVLYHKTLWGKTEDDVMKFLTQGIYTASIRTPMTNCVTSKDEKKNRVVTVLAYDESIVSVYEPEKAIQ